MISSNGNFTNVELFNRTGTLPPDRIEELLFGSTAEGVEELLYECEFAETHPCDLSELEGILKHFQREIDLMRSSPKKDVMSNIHELLSGWLNRAENDQDYQAENINRLYRSINKLNQ